MNIKTLILKGGTELVADVSVIKSFAHNREVVSGYRLDRPFRVVHGVVVVPAPQGLSIQTIVQMAPLLATTIQTFLLLDPEDLIGAPMETNKATEANYVQQTAGILLS